MSDGVIIEIRLRAAPGSDALRGVKAILKHALRRHQLRCVGIALVDEDAPSEDASGPRHSEVSPAREPGFSWRKDE